MTVRQRSRTVAGWIAKGFLLATSLYPVEYFAPFIRSVIGAERRHWQVVKKGGYHDDGRLHFMRSDLDVD